MTTYADSLVKFSDYQEQKSLLGEELIANVSHEIRFPLHGIINLAKEMMEETNSPRNKETSEMILGTARYLLGVANDVIDLSRLKTEQVFDNPKQEYTLRKVIEDVVDVVSVVAKQKNLEIGYHIDENLPLSYIGMSSRLSQVLINLVGNSMKFTNEGFVLIKVQKEHTSKDKNTSFENENQKKLKTIKLRFLIEDSGVGISRGKYNFLFFVFYFIFYNFYFLFLIFLIFFFILILFFLFFLFFIFFIFYFFNFYKNFVEGLKKLFKRFETVDSLHTQEMRNYYKGAGIGLELCKKIVKRMNGEIGVLNSTLGIGTTFFFTAEFSLPEKERSDSLHAHIKYRINTINEENSKSHEDLSVHEQTPEVDILVIYKNDKIAREVISKWIDYLSEFNSEKKYSATIIPSFDQFISVPRPFFSVVILDTEHPQFKEFQEHFLEIKELQELQKETLNASQNNNNNITNNNNTFFNKSEIMRKNSAPLPSTARKNSHPFINSNNNSTQSNNLPRRKNAVKIPEKRFIPRSSSSNENLTHFVQTSVEITSRTRSSSDAKGVNEQQIDYNNQESVKRSLPETKAPLNVSPRVSPRKKISIFNFTNPNETGSPRVKFSLENNNSPTPNSSNGNNLQTTNIIYVLQGTFIYILILFLFLFYFFNFYNLFIFIFIYFRFYFYFYFRFYFLFYFYIIFIFILIVFIFFLI